ncbi:MAG: FAD-dependent oxidoreductase [Candidatus Cyclobacteriaceae bacterium M2_1C_046]
METKSTWQRTAKKAPEFPQLKEDITADVVIVGAGITGLTLAYLLKGSGKKIVVLEADEIGSGTTGFSSNHLTTHIDFGYKNVKNKFSGTIMKTVAESRVQSIELLEEIIKNENISCDFMRTDGFLYAEKEKNSEEASEEYKYSTEAGLPVEESDSFGLPFQVDKVYKYKGQAIFNTQKFLNGLSEIIDECESCAIYCHTEATSVDNTNKRVKTQHGSVDAENIVLATHIPQFINILQTMVVPYRSYMISAQLKDDNYPEGLYWDSQDPYHYTRTYQQGNEKWLLVGGADHETGHEENENHYKKLEKYVRRHFNVHKIENKWSAQYYEPADGLPYIGKSPFSNVFVATGFSGDGLVYGVLSAIILESEINGKEHKWLKAYDARRFKPAASAKEFFRHNTHVAQHLITGFFKSGNLDDINPGEGKVITYEGQKYAVSKDDDGNPTAVSAICPHMGCVVNWNSDEETWDCPCHGSRFHSTGRLIEGPAVNGLERFELGENENDQE